MAVKINCINLILLFTFHSTGSILGAIQAHEVFLKPCVKMMIKVVRGSGLYQRPYNQLMASQTVLFMFDAQIAHKWDHKGWKQKILLIFWMFIPPINHA